MSDPTPAYGRFTEDHTANERLTWRDRLDLAMDELRDAQRTSKASTSLLCISEAAYLISQAQDALIAEEKAQAIAKAMREKYGKEDAA